MDSGPPERPATIPALVVQGAREFADRDFILTPERRLSFTDAEAQSRRLALRLLRAGVGKGTRVGVLFPQGPDFVVAFFAITRIGAIAVPLSTFATAPELRRAVRHADVAMLLAPREIVERDAQRLFQEVWPQLGTTSDAQLFLDDAPYLRQIWIVGGGEEPWATDVPALNALGDASAADRALLTAVESEVTPADPMVIVTTSGATAAPKAVVHAQGAQVRHARTMADLYELTDEDRTFTTMPFFWVGGLTVVVLSHLHVGASVATVERIDSTQMLDLIEEIRATRLLGWTVYERISADPTFARRDLSSVIEMRPPELATPGSRHNSLGMTETGGPHTAASRKDNAVDLPVHLRGSFGPAVPGMQHKIVDPETGDELERGVEGEICVRGDNLMLGLYKKEPRDTFDADGWYHSGDKGYLRDGFLFFTGRLTEMIKTGGANVAPREVELAIEARPGVQAAFVVGIPDDERGELVGCVVCPEPGHALDPAALRDELREELAGYKIPREIKVVAYDDMPWLPTGKVSRPRLVALLADGES
jgi:acyl-CoA synthetase (AMP-forming)/AMP-acid ligase II